MAQQENKVTLILPAYNEAKALPKLLHSIPMGIKVLVIDNNSINGTKDIAEALGAEVIYEGRQGKGFAVQKALSCVETPCALMADADGTYPAGHILELLSLSHLPYDIVFFPRKWKEKASMTHLHSFGNRCLSLWASFLYWYWVEDICTGMIAFLPKALKHLRLKSGGFTIDAEIFIQARRQGLSIFQIPIRYSPRLEGDRPKLKFTHGFQIAWFLLRERFVRRGH